MKDVTIILDNGHGGLSAGTYKALAGGRFHTFEDGTTIYEGEFNRYIVTGICMELTKLGIKYINLVPEYNDITLATRVNRANKFNKNKSFLISVHANAGGGTGFEVFTSVGQTKSDKIADVFAKEFQLEFPSERLRSDPWGDADLDKERNFHILKYTRMPAILTENFFMDTERECKDYLLSREGRNRIIDFHVRAIRKVIDELY
jgi:N-acetylmuramoyl-L-alanine amidase